MACIASFSFSMHLFAPETLDKEMHPKRLALVGRLSRQTTSTGGMKLLVLKCSRTDSSFAVRNSDRRSLESSTQLSESVFRHPDIVSFSRHTILCGFWVGPDVEDGWGFVQAFVNHLT